MISKANLKELNKRRNDMLNTPLQLLKSVNRFSERMFKRLLDNAHKSHWSLDSRMFLLQELDKRLQQLKEIYPNESTPVKDFTNKCADIANFAMMLADNYERRRYDTHGEIDKVSDGQPY